MTTLYTLPPSLPPRAFSLPHFTRPSRSTSPASPLRVITGILFTISFRSSNWYIYGPNYIGPFIERFFLQSEFYSRETEKFYEHGLYFFPYILSLLLYTPISILVCVSWGIYCALLNNKYDQDGYIGYGFILFITGTILLALSKTKHYTDYIATLIFLIIFYSLTPLIDRTEIKRGTLENSTTILISIDGINNDIFKGVIGNTALSHFYIADYLESTYVTKTLPAHWTLATGLDPVEHGLIDNTVKDPVLGTFKFTDKNTNSKWWHGVPLWFHKRSLVYDWPGPNTTIPYSYKTLLTDKNKIDIVIGALSERPELIMTHLNSVDETGHVHGASSIEYKNSIKGALSLISYLENIIERIDSFSKIRLFVVGDHGLTDINKRRVITLEQLGVRDEDIQINSKFGISLPFITNDTYTRAIELNCTVHFKQPSDHPRTPNVTISADIGWMIGSAHGQKGYHGYSNTYRDMRTIFFTNVPGNYGKVLARDVKGIVLG